LVIAQINPKEEVLTSIWCGELKLDRIGMYDNFFKLGGHPLLAARVSARLREAFQIELPLPALFEVPSVDRLTRRVEVARSVAAIVEGDAAELIDDVANEKGAEQDVERPRRGLA
jgi:hypothetical protein